MIIPIMFNILSVIAIVCVLGITIDVLLGVLRTRDHYTITISDKLVFTLIVSAVIAVTILIIMQIVVHR